MKKAFTSSKSYTASRSKGKEHKKYEFDNKAQDFVGSHLRLVAFYCMTESICVSVLACGVRP